MRKIKNFVLTIFVLAFLVFGAQNVSAASDYTISKYKVDMVVNEDNSFDITEEITANFSSPKHGIFREIPLSNRVVREDGAKTKNRAKVTNIKVSDEFEKTIKNGALELKIGDPDRMITGERTYAIKYKYSIGNDPLENADELYYNLVGNNWDTTISNFSFKITMPKDFDKAKLGISSGKFGTSGSKDVIFVVSGREITGLHIGTLKPHEGVTVRLELPEGYFIKKEISPIYGLFYVLPLIGAVVAVFFWTKYGKDRKIFVKPEYFPPEGMNSLEVGFCYRGVAENKDVTSLLIYLANKGYLSIEEYEEGGAFKKKSFRLHKLKDYDGKNENEKLFLKGLFKSGKTVTSSDLYDEFYKTKNQILINQNSKENREKLFEKNGMRAKILALFIVVSFILISVPPFIESGDFEEMIFALLFPSVGLLILTLAFSSSTLITGELLVFFLIFGLAFGGLPAMFMLVPEILSETYFAIGFLVGLIAIVIMFVFMALIPKRTQYGAEKLAEIKGLKDFLTSVEKERIEKMVEEYPNYFYDILPYTYVLGISNKWVAKFESINLQAPDWYRGSSAFSVYSFGSFMNSTMASAATSMSSSPSSSSSGGFSGGGFSGGGSGGGGGGSW